ncbi:MAG TPA: hypothetical protein VHG89_08620 [Verrucomicrobiae bacterium]|nr:hypothetical protein [Verrucomicrobiae bacterium]
MFRMKTMLFTLVAAMIAMQSFAADTKAADDSLKKISTYEATNYYDQEVIVTGKVTQVTIRPKVTFLNLDKSYPNSPFTVVIFHGHSSFFGDANALKGKNIEIKGTIKNYNDKPEIALDNTNQLTVVGVTNLDLFLKPKSKPSSTNAPAAAPPADSSGIM